MANEPIIADKNYYEDVDGNLVDGDSPEARFLVAGEGTEIDAETAKKYGIKQTAAKAEEEVGGGEKASSPPANKAKVTVKNKGAK